LRQQADSMQMKAQINCYGFGKDGIFKCLL